jgi:hypothetical protein
MTGELPAAADLFAVVNRGRFYLCRIAIQRFLLAFR